MVFPALADCRRRNGARQGGPRYRGAVLASLRVDLHEQFFPIIKAEFELTRDLILDYSDHETLLEGDITLQRAIMLRNPYVDPMSLMQVDLLSRWRASNYEDEDIFNALLASVNGIAQGLQNTG